MLNTAPCSTQLVVASCEPSLMAHVQPICSMGDVTVVVHCRLVIHVSNARHVRTCWWSTTGMLLGLLQVWSDLARRYTHCFRDLSLGSGVFVAHFFVQALSFPGFDAWALCMDGSKHVPQLCDASVSWPTRILFLTMQPHSVSMCQHTVCSSP